MEAVPKQQSEKRKSPLERMHEIISNARKGVEEEFTGTGNSWCACFKSPIEGIETYLSLAKTVFPEDRKTYHERLERLKTEMHELSYKYPDKNLSPDQKTQDALFRKLNIFEEYKEDQK